MNMHMHKSMGMTIDFSCKTTIIFDIFEVNGCDIYYFLALFIVFILSLGFEYCLSLRKSFLDNVNFGVNQSNDIEEIREDTQISMKLKMISFYLSIVLYSFLIMFLLMTYNFGIIITVIIGNVIGYYSFGFPEKRVRIGENCGVCST